MLLAKHFSCSLPFFVSPLLYDAAKVASTSCTMSIDNCNNYDTIQIIYKCCLMQICHEKE